MPFCFCFVLSVLFDFCRLFVFFFSLNILLAIGNLPGPICTLFL